MEIKGPKMKGIFIVLLAVVAETSAAVAPCDQPKETGPCRALLRRWFFNKGTGRCEQFNYGGCRGNVNNFKSQTLCEQECGTGAPSGAPKIPPPPGPPKHGGADHPIGMPPTSTKRGARPQKWKQHNMNGNGRISFNVKSDFPTVPKYSRHPSILYRPETPSAGGSAKKPQMRPRADQKTVMAGRLSTNQASMTTKPATFSVGSGPDEKIQGRGKTQTADSQVVYLTNQGQQDNAQAASQGSQVQSAASSQGQMTAHGSREHWEKTQSSQGQAAPLGPGVQAAAQTAPNPREHILLGTSPQGQMTVQGSREHWEKTQRSQSQASLDGPKTQAAAQTSQGQATAQDPREHVILLGRSAKGSKGQATGASGNTQSSGQKQQSNQDYFGTGMVGSSTFQTRTKSHAHSDHSHSHPTTKTKSAGIVSRRKMGGTPVSQVAQAGASLTAFDKLRNSLGMAVSRHGSPGDGNAHPQSRLAASGAGAKGQGGSGPEVTAGSQDQAADPGAASGPMAQGGTGQGSGRTGAGQGEAGSAKGQGAVPGSAGKPWGRGAGDTATSAALQGQAGSAKGQGAVQGSAGRILAKEAGSRGSAVQGVAGAIEPAGAVGAGGSGQATERAQGGSGGQGGQIGQSDSGTSSASDSKVSASSSSSSSQTEKEQGGTQQGHSKAEPQATETRTAAQISGPPNRMPIKNAVAGTRPSGRFGLPKTRTRYLKLGSRKSIVRRPYSDAVVESGSQTSSVSSSSSSVYRQGISDSNTKQQGQGSQGGSDGIQGGSSVSPGQPGSSQGGQASVSTSGSSQQQDQASASTVGANNAAGSQISAPGRHTGQSVAHDKSSGTKAGPYIPPTKTKAGPSPFRKQKPEGLGTGKTGAGAVEKVPVEREGGVAVAGGSGGSDGGAGNGIAGLSAPAKVIHPEILRRKQPVDLAQTGGPDLSGKPGSGGTAGPNDGSGGSGGSGGNGSGGSGTEGSHGSGGSGGQGGWKSGGKGGWTTGGAQGASTGGEGGANTGASEGQGGWTDGRQGGWKSGGKGGGKGGGNTWGSEGQEGWTAWGGQGASAGGKGGANTGGSGGQGGWIDGGNGGWKSMGKGGGKGGGNNWGSGGKGSWTAGGGQGASAGGEGSANTDHSGGQGRWTSGGQGGWKSGGKGGWAAADVSTGGEGSANTDRSGGQGGWVDGGQGDWKSEGQGGWKSGGQGGGNGGQGGSSGGNNGATGGSGSQRRCSSNPVCASDGYTYLSDCYLRPGLETACDGFCPCKQPPPPPKPAARPPFARPIRYKPPTCTCDDVYDPVCGINGETYGNDCERRCAYVGSHCKEACPCGSKQKPIPSKSTIAKYNLTADGKTQAQAAAMIAAMITTTLPTTTTIGTTIPPPTTMPYVPTITPYVPPTPMYVHTAPPTRLKQAPRPISTTPKSKFRKPVRSRSRPGRRPRPKRPKHKKKPTTAIPTTPKPEPIEKEPLEQEAGSGTTTTQAPYYDYYNSASNTAYYDTYNPGPYYNDPYNVNNNQYTNNNNVNNNVYTPYKNPGACTCPRYSSPVCGTDGITYENPCTLNCAHVGFGCGKECPCYAPASAPVNLEPCESQCPAAYSPACSVNRNTFHNYCMMECSGEQEACAGECPCQYDLSYTNTDVNNEPSNQPLSTCECAPNDVDPVCTVDGETIWYGCEAICLGVTVACTSACPC